MNLIPIAESDKPLWALDVNQKKWDWNRNNINPMMPFFDGQIPFVLPPQEGSGEPFYSHNHQPSITYLDNGDLMAVWYSTNQESGTEMTVLASRFRAGEQTLYPMRTVINSRARECMQHYLMMKAKTGR